MMILAFYSSRMRSSKQQAFGADGRHPYKHATFCLCVHATCNTKHVVRNACFVTLKNLEALILKETWDDWTTK